MSDLLAGIERLEGLAQSALPADDWQTVGRNSPYPSVADLRLIAASDPDTILALCAVVRAAEAHYAKTRKAGFSVSNSVTAQPIFDALDHLAISGYNTDAVESLFGLLTEEE